MMIKHSDPMIAHRMNATSIITPIVERTLLVEALKHSDHFKLVLCYNESEVCQGWCCLDFIDMILVMILDFIYAQLYMKKFLISIVVSLFFVNSTQAFVDIGDVPAYSESINILKSKGVLKSSDYFFPKKELNRIEFIQMMYMSGIFPDKCVYSPIRFSDTDLNQWYTPALRTGVLCGGVKGNMNNEFRPGDTITYAEAATLLYRSTHDFSQSTNGFWYEAGMVFLEESKIVLNKEVEPHTLLNRAEGAFLLEKAINSPASIFSGKKLVESARKQKGVVTSYDTGYYAGGYPPENTGACTDVIERALRDLGYDWKGEIDTHMRQNPHLYQAEYDSNINYRRVRNVKVFLDHNAKLLPIDNDFQPGDIVTYDQIPGGLWHIAIVSDRKASDGTPLLIHNYSSGVKEDNLLHNWPAPKTGHYRLEF